MRGESIGKRWATSVDRLRVSVAVRNSQQLAEEVT